MFFSNRVITNTSRKNAKRLLKDLNCDEKNFSMVHGSPLLITFTPEMMNIGNFSFFKKNQRSISLVLQVFLSSKILKHLFLIIEKTSQLHTLNFLVSY